MKKNSCGLFRHHWHKKARGVWSYHKCVYGIYDGKYIMCCKCEKTKSVRLGRWLKAANPFTPKAPSPPYDQVVGGQSVKDQSAED